MRMSNLHSTRLDEAWRSLHDTFHILLRFGDRLPHFTDNIVSVGPDLSDLNLVLMRHLRQIEQRSALQIGKSVRTRFE